MLKTRSDHFKEHWAVLQGKDLLCYRQRFDPETRVMHCLTGTYVQENAAEIDPQTKEYLYPVRIVIPPNKSRILYFTTEELQKKWANTIRQTNNFSNVHDFYTIDENLGKGQFGVVKLASHKLNGG